MSSCTVELQAKLRQREIWHFFPQVLRYASSGNLTRRSPPFKTFMPPKSKVHWPALCPKAVQRTESRSELQQAVRVRGVGKPCSFKLNTRAEFESSPQKGRRWQRQRVGSSPSLVNAEAFSEKEPLSCETCKQICSAENSWLPLAILLASS